MCHKFGKGTLFAKVCLPVILTVLFKMSVENKEIKILMGYVNKFDYVDESEQDLLGGHPLPGRVYRLIKDDSGYRLHIGRENNDAHIDGWMLGKKLKNKLRAYSFDIQIIDAENYADIKLHPEDVTKMVEWLKDDNKDLYDYLLGAQPVAVPTTTPLEQLRQLLMAHQEFASAVGPNTVAAASSSDLGYTLEIVLIKGDPITITGTEHHSFSDVDCALLVKQSSGYVISIPLTNILYTSQLA